MIDFNSPEFVAAAKEQANKTESATALIEQNKIAEEKAAADKLLQEQNSASEAQKLEADKQAAIELENKRVADEKAKEEAAKNPVPFEDQLKTYLKDKTKGKYEKFEDIETILNTPKEEFKFADDNVKHLNDLASKGIKITKEIIALQATDYDKEWNTDDLLAEKWKLGDEGKGLSDKAIKTLIHKKYNVDEWRDKAQDDLTEDDILNQELMLRDASLSRDWLKNYKAERLLVKDIDPTIAKEQEKKNLEYKQNWDIDTDNSVKEITKLSSPLNDKESFDFAVSDEDRKEIAAVVKASYGDASAPFHSFIEKDNNGNTVKVNKTGIEQMLLKAKNYDKAVALAHSEGAAKERLRIEKESKNIVDTPNESGTGQPRAYKSLQEAFKDQHKGKV